MEGHPDHCYYYFDEHFARDGRSTIRRSAASPNIPLQACAASALDMTDLTPVIEVASAAQLDEHHSAPLTSTRLFDAEMDEIDEGDGPPPLAPLTDEIRSIAAGAGGLGRLSRKASCRSSKSVIQKKMVSREAFFAQAILIYIISVACVVNLSLGTGPSHVWVALLSGCLGYILPEPKIRREKVRSVLDLPKDTESLGRE